MYLKNAFLSECLLEHHVWTFLYEKLCVIVLGCNVPWLSSNGKRNFLVFFSFCEIHTYGLWFSLLIYCTTQVPAVEDVTTTMMMKMLYSIPKIMRDPPYKYVQI
jgi:hypothetical protein